MLESKKLHHNSLPTSKCVGPKNKGKNKNKLSLDPTSSYKDLNMSIIVNGSSIYS